MKRVLCLLCALLMLLSVTGCGSAPQAAPSESAQPAGPADSSSTAEMPEKPYEGTTIRVLSMTAQVSDGIEQYLKDFEESTGIKVNLELYGEAQLREKLTTEFLAGSSTVDVFLFSPIQEMGAYEKNGWIEPLDEYFNDEAFDWADFSSAPMDQVTLKESGKIGAIPLYSSVQLMYYRKDVFEEKGLTPPKNYDELLDVCAKLNDPANNFYAIACRGEKVALTSQYSPFLFGFGGQFIKDGVSAFDSPEALDATKFYGKLLGEYAPPGILTAGYSQMTQLYNSGQVAMVIDANALYSTLTDEAESIYFDKVGVAPIPEGPQGRQSYKQVVWASAIYSGSKNKEAAWEFIKFVSGKDVAAYITPKGMPSFRASVWEDPRVAEEMTEDVINAYSVVNGAETTNPYGLPRLTAVGEARDAMGDAVVYSIETKGEGPELETRMKTAAEKVNTLLKDAGEYGPDYNY